MLLLCFLTCSLLIFMAGIVPKPETMSSFELHRRKKQGDEMAEAILRRRSLLGDMFSLQKILISLPQIILDLLLV